MEDIRSIDKKSRKAPHSNEDMSALSFTVTGKPGKKHNYEIEVSVKELALLLDVPLSKSTDNVAARAFRKAVACFLEETPGTDKKNP